VRVGDWKLVAKGPGGAWELYNLAEDRTESKDLAARHPEKVEDLALRWEAWAKRANVLPWIWEKEYKPIKPTSRPAGREGGRS
jgi:arylsulfatase A-like enzyme